MKKILALLALVPALLLGAPQNIQKDGGALTASFTVPSGVSISATGTGTIAATSVTGLTLNAVVIGGGSGAATASDLSYSTPTLTAPAGFGITGATSLTFTTGGTNQPVTFAPSGNSNGTMTAYFTRNMATSATAQGLEIISDIGATAIGTNYLISTYGTSGNNYGRLAFNRARGTFASPGELTNGDTMGAFIARAYFNGSFGATAEIDFIVDGAVTTNQRPPSRMEFYTNASNGSQALALLISSAQEVLIGSSTDAGAYALQVTGSSYTSGGIQIGTNAAAGSLTINGPAASTRDFRFQTAGLNRWIFRANSNAESSANAGSSFVLAARDDAGAALGNVFDITRATGKFQIQPVSGSVAAWGTTGVAFAVNYSTNTATITDSSSSGTVGSAVGASIGIPTFAATSSTTYTNAASFYVDGDVAAGTNVTISNSYGIWNAGKSRLVGRVDAPGGVNINPGGGGGNAYLTISGDFLVKDAFAYIDTNATNPRTIFMGPGAGGAAQFGFYDSTAAVTVWAYTYATGAMNFGKANRSASSWTTTGIVLNTQASRTFTNSSTAASGTAASAVFTSFAIPTLAATNATVTTTDAATVYIAGQPAAGTNMTITNPWSLWVDAGNVRLDGTIRTASAVDWDLGAYTAGAPTPDGYLTVIVAGTTYRISADLQP